MHQRWGITLWTLCLLPMVMSLGQAQTTAPRQVVVSLHENMINSFFEAVGKVSGKGEKSGVNYKWTVIEPNIDLEPGVAKFSARVKLDAGAFETIEKAKGEVTIEYIKETNRLRIQVREAKVKLHIKLLGKEIPIGTIDIARYYKPAFEFAGPQPIQKEIDIELPDGSFRKMQINTKNETLIIEKDRVSVYSDLEFITLN